MAAMAAVDGTTGAAAALLEEACSEEEAAMESEDSSSEGSGTEDLPETAAATAAASATQQEYAELVAGLLRNPEAHFAASSFDLLHALREEQQQLSRQQQELGAQRLKTQWLPLIQQLQQLQQQEQQMRRPPQQQPQGQQQKKSDRVLVLRYLQALQEDGAAWERQAKTEAPGRRSSSSSEDSELTTAGLLQQLDGGQLFHRSGRLFTAVDADTEVWTSSDDEEPQRQQHRNGSSSSSSRQCLGNDGIGGVDDEKLRFPAAVLPLRAALRGVRRQQRDELQVRQLLLQWAQPDSRLGQLQHVAAVWDEDGLFSAARAAAQQGQQQQQPPTEQQQQQQQQQRKKGQQPQQEDGGVIERGNDVAHALAELQQVEQLEVAKRGRRELRAWKAAARELFGWDMYGGLEQLLQSAAVAAAQTSTGSGGAVAAARALLPDEEQQQLLRLLRRRWMNAEEPQEVAGGEGEGQQQQEENNKIFLSAKEREESSTKKRQGRDRERGERPLPQVQELSISPPPACFFSHGLEELRCVSCRVWLTQTQQLLQLQQEGACSFLLQPVQTHLVKQLLLLQQEQRLQRVLGGRQVATAGAAAAAAAARLHAAAAAPTDVRGPGPAVARISAASAGGEGAPAAATGAEGGEEGERWETDEGYKIIAAPDVGLSPHAEKLYVGHLGLLYTTVWGGGYSCGPHTSELLLWLRLLQPFQPLQLRRDGPPRSRERHAQRWQLLRDAYYRSGVSQSQQQQKQQPFYILPFEDQHQQQQPKKAKNATAPAYKSLYSRALQKKDKIVVETDVDSSETEGEARERRRLAAARQKQQQLTVPQRQQRSKGAAVAAASSTSSPSLARASHASFSAAAEDVELEMAEEAEGCVTTPPGRTTAATGSGQQEAAYQGRILGEEDDASDEEEIDVSRYLRYLGKGFVHVNRAWMHKPFRRRRLPLPLPGGTASDAAPAAVGKDDTGSGSSRSQGGVKTARGSSSAAQKEAAASWRSGEHIVLSQQHRFRDKATAEAEDQHQQQPHPAENGDFTWTVELSSSEDSVRAYQGGAARYRRRYRVWRRRQRDLRARRLQQQQQQQETSDNPTSRCSSPRGATSAAGVEAASGAAALAAAGDPGAVDESRQGHALEDFLKRLGGMSYSRYSQLAATAAAGAAAAAAAARKQLLGGRLKRRRGEGRSSSSRSAGPSAEQRAAALQLQQLRPRRVWGWYWAAETGDEEEEEEEERGLGFMHMLNFRRKLYRMRRKPRTRAVEPSWDPQLQQRTRGKQGSIQQPQQQRRWQLQQPWQQQRSVDEAAAETEQSSPRVFPFGVAATGWWGPSGGDTAEVRDKEGPPAGKGREVQFICVDDRELHRRMGKTRLYQERFEGLEDELTNRREYYAVVDEENRRIHVVPAGRLSFFLTETPRQIENDFMEQMFGDLRRNARGSFLQTLLLKRRSARNVLLMNAMLWQSQLKHLNQIRLCRLLGGFWRDAALASGDAPLTEQQLLDDFLSVNTHALRVLEAAAAEGAGAGSIGGGNATAPQQEASTRWTHAAAALEDRWRQERTSAAAEETEEHGGINSAETPLVDAAAARLRVPRAALRVIDQAATDASAVAALAAAAADRRSQRETCRRLLPRLLLRYIHRVFPAFMHVYLTSRCAFAVQKAEEQNFTRRVRQVENVGLAGVGNVGSFTGEVLRGQLERTFGQRTALRPTNRTKEEEADLDRLKEVLPPFNNKATTPAELFKLGDLVPLGLLEDVEMEGFSGDPFLPFIKGGKGAEIVDAAALEEQWGRFTVDLARRIGQERRNISATKTDGAVVDSVLRTLSAEALARLVKVTKALAALFRKQRKTFSGERAVTRFFEDLIKSSAGGNTSAPGKGNIGASQTLPQSGIRWVTKTFLQEDGRGRYFLSPEKQTKLLATLVWVCAALSVRRTFDFEALLSDEWRGRFNLNFEACAALVGLRRLRSKARSREYSLELPPALMQAGTHSTSRLTPVLPLVTREKGRRTVR